MNQPPSTNPSDPTPQRVVLVVDDEAVIRDLASAILGRAGYAVLCAGDGRSALEVFDAHRGQIDVVLLDESMPVLDGTATLRELRRRRLGIPVIFSSGHYDAEARVSESDVGAPPALLRKPYRASALLDAVRAALGEQDRDEPRARSTGLAP